LLLGAAAVTAFILAARSGQFDDLETPPQRVLYDDVEVKPRSEPCTASVPTDPAPGTDAQDR
jgi:cbb3-type cytochrome oxidase maturation protein